MTQLTFELKSDIPKAHCHPPRRTDRGRGYPTFGSFTRQWDGFSPLVVRAAASTSRDGWRWDGRGRHYDERGPSVTKIAAGRAAHGQARRGPPARVSQDRAQHPWHIAAAMLGASSPRWPHAVGTGSPSRSEGSDPLGYRPGGTVVPCAVAERFHLQVHLRVTPSRGPVHNVPSDRTSHRQVGRDQMPPRIRHRGLCLVFVHRVRPKQPVARHVRRRNLLTGPRTHSNCLPATASPDRCHTGSACGEGLTPDAHQ
jgi:hypothetical protein